VTHDSLGGINAAFAGRYVLERELGRGGMGTVYLARDPRHDRLVAIKVLRDELSGQVGAERFLREIRIAATLQHPNILTLIDSGDAGGVLHYVMPYAEGESLRERVARGAMSPLDAMPILREVIDALAYAHNHGVVHRDVKPDNIILSGRHALVVDFGVAKAMSALKESLHEQPGETLTQVGTSIGTPAYMAPEQAAGDPHVDHRADIYALGIVAYEMLAGRPPFTGAPSTVRMAQISTPPPPLSTAVPSAPAWLVLMITRCLEKDPAKRYQSADELLAELDTHAAPERSGTSRRALSIAAVAVLLVVGTGAALFTKRLRGERWARTTAIPDIERLIEASAYDSAFAVAVRAEEFIGADSALARLWPRLSGKVVFKGVPAGARVYRTAYNDSLGWRELPGSSDSVRVPAGQSRWRIESPGYRTRTVVGTPAAVRSATLTLEREDAPNPEMVRVAGGNAEVAMPGLSRLPIVPLPSFFIDRYEVTNDEFKRFVDAGGYEKPEYWEHPIIEGGRTVTFDAARRLFVDRTGRVGPATWEGGAFPSGQADLPVGGISWYEAAAYAKFVGKSLPTLYHWVRAAGTPLGAMIIPGSNYRGQGVSRGSTFGGMSPSGAFDMAGNVREWIWNAVGERRYVLGGGFSDGTYAFSDAYAQRPLDRSAINGIRLMRAASDSGFGPELTRVAVKQEYRDYTKERPASDAVFEGYRGYFVYDRTPFNSAVRYRDTAHAEWIRERVDFDAAYGGERMGAVVLTPKGKTGPFQAVVTMGGSNLLYTRTDSVFNAASVDFILRSGRAVVLPVYKAMFDRNIGLTSDSPQETSAYRDLIVALVKDTRRTIDYLGTRTDIDTSRIAYLGLSFGGRVAPPVIAMEPRFKAALLMVTGLKMEHARPEVDPLNFLPRIHVPVLMLNGKYDYYFPVETAQKPFYEYLGTPREHKKWVVYPEAHTTPRTEFVRESLAWLDRYLGPAK
jgi:formylglycine-generating enzyme required for sulfatase activity/dienelactone hydrolase